MDAIFALAIVQAAKATDFSFRAWNLHEIFADTIGVSKSIEVSSSSYSILLLQAPMGGGAASSSSSYLHESMQTMLLYPGFTQSLPILCISASTLSCTGPSIITVTDNEVSLSNAHYDARYWKLTGSIIALSF